VRQTPLGSLSKVSIFWMHPDVMFISGIKRAGNLVMKLKWELKLKLSRVDASFSLPGNLIIMYAAKVKPQNFRLFVF